MDEALKQLLSYGVSGVLTAILVWILVRVMQRSDVSLDTRVAWLEGEIARQRVEFLAALIAQRTAYSALIDRIEAALAHQTDALVGRLDRIDSHLEQRPTA